MPGKPVITSNTPLVALWVLGRLDILGDLYGEVWIPQAIQDEFLATERALRQSALLDAPWIITVPLAAPQRTRVYVGLDQGEAEVLALAEEHAACLVIIDERKGRRYAERMGLPLTGTLGVLLLAKERGLVPSITLLLAELRKEGLCLDQDLVQRVLALAKE